MVIRAQVNPDHDAALFWAAARAATSTVLGRLLHEGRIDATLTEVEYALLEARRMPGWVDAAGRAAIEVHEVSAPDPVWSTPAVVRLHLQLTRL